MTTTSNGFSEACIEDVAFAARWDGTPQRYVQVTPAGWRPDEAVDVMVVLHGHGSDRWQFVRNPRDECRAARDVALQRRVLFVAPDYRATTSWMGPAAESDVLDILHELPSRLRVGRVFVVGGSMGGTSALTFAALHPELVSGVAAMNAIANHVEYQGFQDAIAASFGSRSEAGHEYERRSAELHANRLTMPVGLTTGGLDTSTPPASVLRLAETLRLAGRPVLLIHREQEGHRTAYDDARTIIEFAVDGSRPRQEG